MVAYRNYLGRANPSVSTDNKTFYYTFKRGDNAFFVLDTRSHRKTTNAAGTSLPYADAARSMLGLAQLQHLLSWLSAMQTQGGAVFKL